MRRLATLLAFAVTTAAWASESFVDDEDDSVPGALAPDDHGGGAPAPTSRVLPIPPLKAGPPPTGALPKSLADIAVAVRDQPLGARIQAITDAMVGTPYKLDGLGEGSGYDPDPLARYDAYDCIGFIEEAFALAMAGDPAHASEIRDRLRYGAAPGSGTIDYAHRRHFMELQWIPGNVADGFVVDTTARYGATVHMEREVTPDTWKRWRKRSGFHLTDDELPLGTMKLDVLPIDEALKAVDKLPTGAIVLTVRKDVGTPVWISHTGIVVHDANGKTIHRNATRRTGMSVLDEDLARYLRHLQSYGKWPCAGVAILEPIDPWGRKSALETP